VQFLTSTCAVPSLNVASISPFSLDASIFLINFTFHCALLLHLLLQNLP
jgi:hypothetical protein